MYLVLIFFFLIFVYSSKFESLFCVLKFVDAKVDKDDLKNYGSALLRILLFVVFLPSSRVS